MEHPSHGTVTGQESAFREAPNDAVANVLRGKPSNIIYTRMFLWKSKVFQKLKHQETDERGNQDLYMSVAILNVYHFFPVV